MKRNYLYINSKTLQFSVETRDILESVSDMSTDRIIFRSYPETVELKEFKFECISECEDQWETKSVGSDAKDAIANFRIIYPNDKILTVTE